MQPLHLASHPLFTFMMRIPAVLSLAILLKMKDLVCRYGACGNVLNYDFVFIMFSILDNKFDTDVIRPFFA